MIEERKSYCTGRNKAGFSDHLVCTEIRLKDTKKR